MTIKDCIDTVDNIKPNQYTIRDKVMWLSFIEEIIINEVLKTHEGYDGSYDDFEGYSEDKLSVPLIVSTPYDRLYTAFLKMKIDEENGETARYNNSMLLYNTYMEEYRKYYNKTHMPIDTFGKVKVIPPRKTADGLSDAEFENLKRELIFILSEYFSNTVPDDKLEDIVTKYVQNNIEMLKGKDGKDGLDGIDGYTPVKGVDYFTEAEKEELLSGKADVEALLSKLDFKIGDEGLNDGIDGYFDNEPTLYKVTKGGSTLFSPYYLIVMKCVYSMIPGVSVKTHVQYKIASHGIYRRYYKDGIRVSSYWTDWEDLSPGTDSAPKKNSKKLLTSGAIYEALQDIETNKADKTDIPTKTSELTNDSGYLTKNDIDNVLKTFVATYTTKELVAGITAQVGVRFIYEEEIDSFSITVEDTVVVDKAPINEKARVAAELLKAEKTRFVFYDGDNIVYTAKILNTLPGKGMLFIEN